MRLGTSDLNVCLFQIYFLTPSKKDSVPIYMVNIKKCVFNNDFLLISMNLLTTMDVMLNTFTAQSFVPFNNGADAGVESVR